MNEAQTACGYGWTSNAPTHSLSYIAPSVIPVLKGLGARRVLDLGAGNGALCDELGRAGFDAVGVEIDEAGVAIARASCPGLRFYCFGVQDDPRLLLAQEPAFDVVVSTEVIEHLYSPHQLPIYAHSVLRSGGHLVITTPYHGYAKNLALSLAGKWDHHHTALWHGGHVKFWSRRTLTRLLSDNGFHVESFMGLGRMPWLWKSMLLVAKKN